MEDFIQYLSRKQEPWKTVSFGSLDSLSVTEIWQYGSNKDTKVVQTMLEGPLAVTTWLNTHQPHAQNAKTPQRLLWRAAWVPYDPDPGKTDLSVSSFDQVLNTLGLSTAYNYIRSVAAGATRMPTTSPEAPEVWAFCLNPKLATAWSRWPEENFTNNFILTQQSQIDEMQKLARALASCADQPMFTALLCAALLTRQIEKQLEAVKVFIRGVEKRTGYHRFNKKIDPAEGELVRVSADVNGWATKLASDLRKADAVKELMQFILEETQRRGGREETPATNDGYFPAQHTKRSGIEEVVDLLNQRMKMLMIDVKFIQRRVDVQIQADAAAMKLIALVTMIYLPGTFVAQVFSMPVFNWDLLANPANAINPGFGIYWAVTITITLATFATWVIWSFIQNRRERHEMQALEEQAEEHRKRVGTNGHIEKDEKGKNLSEAELFEMKSPSVRFTADSRAPTFTTISGLERQNSSFLRSLEMMRSW